MIKNRYEDVINFKNYKTSPEYDTTNKIKSLISISHSVTL